jgi:hypothetical protein
MNAIDPAPIRSGRNREQLQHLVPLLYCAAAAAAAAGAAAQGLAVVPDATRPFTITMRNPKDGLDYVVAHYEPRALQHAVAHSGSSSSSGPVVQLCELFNMRKKDLRMQRVSAAENQLMALAGSRIPRRGGGWSAHYGRYHDDVGE